MSKVLNYAGVSRVAGELKFRTATEDTRFLQLVKLGDKDVEFVRITGVETKQAAAQELLDRNFAAGRADVQALLTAVAAKTSTASKQRTVRVPAVKASKRTVIDKEPKLTIDQANALVLASVREMDPARELELRVFKMIKSRKRRAKTADAV